MYLNYTKQNSDFFSISDMKFLYRYINVEMSDKALINIFNIIIKYYINLIIVICH